LISHQFIVRGNKWPCFSPDGECLSFASPLSSWAHMPRHVRESHQLKGDPSSSPFGLLNRSERTGAPPTRPNRLHKTMSVAELKHGYAFFPSVHFDSATQQGEPRRKSRNNRMFNSYTCIPVVHPLGPLLYRREAHPHGEKRRRVSELRSTGRFVPCVRASCGAAPCGEHRREAEGRHSRGRLSLVTFFGEAKKVTRHQAKCPVGYHPRSNT
jgi:hypothetical protein